MAVLQQMEESLSMKEKHIREYIIFLTYMLILEQITGNMD